MKNTLLLLLAVVSCRFALAQNVDISGGLIFEGEPYMAIDPGNPQHIVVAWMGAVPFVHTSIKIKATFNGGATWSTAAVLPHHSPTFGSADVSMAFDHNGNVYASYVDFRQAPDSGSVYIVKSTDGGLTWGAASEVINGFADGIKYPLDRPWLVIRRCSGGTPDTLYVTTKPAPWVSPPNRPYFVKSYDYGLTWSPWRYIDSTGYLVGNFIQAPMAAPAVDSAGLFHCVYPTFVPSMSFSVRYIMATAGPANSFNYNVAYTVTGASSIDTLAKSGGRFICDPANNLHYAFFCIQNLHGDLDVFYVETLDGGLTWSSPIRVNDDPVSNGKMQDLVWANFDESGNMIAAWRDRRNASGTGYEQPSEIWGAIKWKDSLSFSANFKISDTAAPYDSLYLSGPGNDFMNVAMAQDTMSAVWGDVRTGVLNIWFERRAMRTGVTTTVKHIVSEAVPEVNIYPNPVVKNLTVSGSGISEVTIYDMAARAVLTQRPGNDHAVLDVSRLRQGTYLVVVSTSSGSVARTVEVR